MGKEGELWDDSALINAFADAISDYKKMHGIAQLDTSKTEKQDINSIGEDLSAHVDEKNDGKRQADKGTNQELSSHSKPDLQETSNELPSEVNHEEPHCESSYIQDLQNAHQGYANPQDAKDYNKLLNRYNEIEEQRQKIMQQLEQFNYWNCQESGPNSYWGTWGSSQQYPAIPGQINHPPQFPYVNQCMVAPCYLGGTCTNETSGIACNGQSTLMEDSNVNKAALAAAEKALSSFNIENPEKPKEACEGQLEASVAGETDLNAVFNAWYTAGFYTGKYLAEHSIVKKRHG